MHWHDFADKDDIRANDLYQELRVVGSSFPCSYWHQGWVKVPRKALHHLNRGVHDGDGAILWTGFEWVRVVDYEGSNGRVYIRLPLPGEFDE